MKSYNEWAEEFHPTARQVSAFQGNKISADPQVVSMLRPFMSRLGKLYPDNKEAYSQLLAAAEHLLLDVSRYATASQISKALSTDEM